MSADVLAQEEEHYTWASDTRAALLMAMATGRRGPDSPAAEQTRDELYARAQEMNIRGRSRVTKEQLQAAEQEGEPS